MTRTEFNARFHHIRNVKYEADYPLKDCGRQAAVLIPLVDYGEKLDVLLTQRAKHLRHHPGQVSFPGGAKEPQDTDLVATALRETEEEIGLDPSYVDIVGTLPPYRTISGYSMTPVIGFVAPGQRLRVDENEVADVFEVPLRTLVDRKKHLIHYAQREQKHFPIYFVPWKQRMIWGATAAILRNLSHHLYP
ncbi:CoA pyrophosphatase [Aestuariibacter sp. A3R04]|uniref:CoA pyrophosphatase n=1 Tax=Aestuariibacter sp. A3R04 TaxID=2841571 RepID=UPI001C089373|nr:CoA pyrophosphatase [Aestuariibacter sp. A3R04]MBU3022931.1 CoA pyrophosphatase [Aestuariibacter sp. A3R04]